jgi:hypothetical protein
MKQRHSFEAVDASHQNLDKVEMVGFALVRKWIQG